MTQITLRGIDSEVEREIRKIARKTGKSLNRVILDMIYHHTGFTKKQQMPPAASLKNVSLKDLNYYRNISTRKSRCVISSGGLEPVIDSGGKNGHSIFASSFIDALTDNKGIMDTNSLFSKVRHIVMLNSSQTPEYSDLRNTGHEGGEFLFIRR